MADNGSLAALHTALIDVRNGYEEAIRDAEQPELKTIFRRLKLVHEKAHTELHHLLLARGLTPDDGGSFISVRSAVVGLNEEALSAFAEGEERIVDDYDKAIADNADDAQLVGLLEQQQTALQNEIGGMTVMAAAK